MKGSLLILHSNELPAEFSHEFSTLIPMMELLWKLTYNIEAMWNNIGVLSFIGTQGRGGGKHDCDIYIL